MYKRPLIRKKYTFSAVLRMLADKLMRKEGPLSVNLAPTSEPAEFISLTDPADWSGLPSDSTQEDLFEKLEEYDLRGLGGAGYPVAKKLRAALDNAEQGTVLIINAAECDPGLQHDQWILEHRKEALEEVIKLLRKILPLRQVYLVRKETKSSLDLNGAVSVNLPDIYPAGEEKQAVKYVLGCEVGKDEYPSDHGIWIQNVQSLLSLHPILCGRNPPRYLTMANLDSGKAFIAECQNGTPVEQLAERVFGTDSSRSIYVGGGVMQAARAVPDQRVDAQINLIAVGDAAEFPEKSCRGCGQCSRYCPAGIDVQKVVEQEKAAHPDSAGTSSAAAASANSVSEEIRSSCLSCGLCSYICPAGKDLSSLIQGTPAH